MAFFIGRPFLSFTLIKAFFFFLSVITKMNKNLNHSFLLTVKITLTIFDWAISNKCCLVANEDVMYVKL